MPSKIRTSLKYAAVPIVALAAAHVLYALFGHTAVRFMYEGTAPSVLGGVVQGRDVYPLERYTLQADLEFRRLSEAAWPPALVFSALLFGLGLLAPWTARRILTLGTVVTLIVASSLAWNRLRMDTNDLDRVTDHLLSRAKEVADRAHSFRQEDALAALSPSKVNGFTHWLDEDLAKARIVTAPPADQVSSGPLLEFRFGGGEPLAFAPQKSPHERTPEGTLRCQLLEGDTLINTAPIHVALRDVSRVEIRMRNQQGRNASLSWNTSFPPEKTDVPPLSFRINPGPDFHTYSVRTDSLVKALGPNNILRTISLRPSDAPTDDVEIESIRLISRLSKYAQAPAAISYETMKGEIRRVVHAQLPSRIAFSLQLPDSATFFTFGTGVLKNDMPVTFTVTVSARSKRAPLFQRIELGSAEWNDARIDLSPWAGETVEIELAAEGTPGNVAFWASPGIYSLPKQELNVVILLQDSLRGDRLASVAQQGDNTPVIQQLAKSGVVFTNAYSQETKTRPSVPSLLTSLLPSATGVWFSSAELSDHYLTLTEILRDQGFSTALFTQNPNVGLDSNVHQGFDVVFNDLAGTGINADEFLGNRLLDWVKAQSERNFFLYIHLIDPHGPYNPPSPRGAAYEEAARSAQRLPRIDELDADWVEQPTAGGRRLLYDAEIVLNDHWIGRFLDVLGEHRDDTLLVLSADHGESLGEHGVWGHGPPGYHVALHIPLIFVYPRTLPAGRSLDVPVQLMDVMPTILEVANIETSPLLMHGESLLPLLEERVQDGSGELPSAERESAGREGIGRVAISEEFVNRRKGDPRGRGSIVLQDWHLLSSQDLISPRKVLSWMPDLGLSTRIYNYKSDPREKKVWNTFMFDWMMKAKIMDTLVALEETNKNVIVALRGSKKDKVELDPEVEERLRALGYLK